MKIDTKQSFSKAVKTIDKYDKEIVIENNEPRDNSNNFDDNNYAELTDDEKIYIVAKKILKRHIKAFMNLAKL